MSAKKRKVPTDNSQAAVTPVSAVAARRRLVDPAVTEDDAEEVVSHSLTPSNAFSALRALRRNESLEQKALGKPSSVSSRSAVEGSSTTASAKPNAKSEDATNGVPVPNINVQYSSFTLNKRNSTQLPDGGLELRLQDGEKFMVAGIFRIKVVTGLITIQGAFFHSGDVTDWVCASYVHAIPVIRTHKETCLQLLNDSECGGLRRLGRLSPLYSQLWRRGGENPSDEGGRTFEMIFSSDDIPKRGGIQILASPPTWNRKLADFVSMADKPTRWSTIICGPKSSGKSTISRLLVNRTLTRGGLSRTEAVPEGARAVAVLDIDPGQPEYGPPGTVTLSRVHRPNLGPPFSHPGLPDDSYTIIKSHALASVTPASNPVLYRQCAIDLYDVYNKELPGCPLIVNTPGWIQGTGLELLSDLIRHINPTEVLYMSLEGPTESVDALREATQQEFTTLSSQPSEFTARTAAELREMQMMSYFHLRKAGSRKSWVDQPLSDLKPCVVPYSGRTCISAVLCYDYQAPPELLFDSINGTVLAIVGVKDPLAFGSLLDDPSAAMPHIERTREGIPYISNPNDVALDPRHSQLLGLVLIRGIDSERRCLHGLSPILSEDLPEINAYTGIIVLVHGSFGCPNWAYTESLYLSQAKEEATNKDRIGSGNERAASGAPWVEILEGNQSRPVGSKRWRVRRDLGRGG